MLIRNLNITLFLIFLGFLKLHGQEIFPKRSFSDSTTYNVINDLMDLLKKDTMRTLVADSTQWKILLGKKYYSKKYSSTYNFEQRFYPLFDSILNSCEEDLCRIKLFGYTLDKLFEVGVDLNIDEKISKDESRRHLLGSKYDFERRKLYLFEQIIERYIRVKKHHSRNDDDLYRQEIRNFVKYSPLIHPVSVYQQLLKRQE